MGLKIGKLSWILPILMIAALVVLGLTNVLKLEKVFHLLVNIQFSWIFVIIALQFLTYASLATIWHVVASHGGFIIPLKKLLHLTVEKFAVDQLVPTAGLVGSLVVVKVMKRMGVPQPVAIEALILETVAYYASYGVVALMLMIILVVEFSTFFIIPVLLGLFTAVMMLLAIIIWRLVNHRHFVFPNWLEKHRTIGLFREYLEGVSEERMGSMKILLIIIFFQLSIFTLDALTLWAIFQALLVNADFITALVGFLLASIGGLISLIPGGVGAFEASAVAVLIILGVPLEAAITSILLLRAFTLWFPLIPGTIFAYRDHLTNELSSEVKR